jgi:hypothetical protein
MKKILRSIGAFLKSVGSLLIKGIKALGKVLMRFASGPAVLLYIILAVIDVAFISFVALVKRPVLFGDLEHSPDTHRWDVLLPYVNWALIGLVILLLFIPALWLYNFHKRWQKFNKDLSGAEADDAERRDFLEWLTVTSVPFLVLGFAMVIEFHAISESPENGAGALAAIMVLYALSVLASFLYIEVKDLKKTLAHDVDKNNRWLSLSLALARTTTGEKPPAVSAEGLLEAWGKVYNAAPAEKRLITRTLMGTLLSTYIDEEIKSAEGSLEADRVPPSVRVNGAGKEVFYLATNVGYYATFLKKAVQQLQSAVDDGQSVALATVTYALPPYWWNWPMAKSEHRAYKPITDFRTTLEWLAGRDRSNQPRGRVYRKVLVSEGWETDLLTPKSEWDAMKTWRFLKVGADDLATTQLDLRSQCVEFGKKNLIKPLRWFDGEPLGRPSSRLGYWVVSSDIPRKDAELLREYSTERVVDHYRKVMHPPNAGSTEIYGIRRDLFQNPFFAHASTGQGLNSCSEITFLGVAPTSCVDPWADGCGRWGLALLSTMSPGRDTMFVAAIWGEELLERLWLSVSITIERLSDPLDW